MNGKSYVVDAATRKQAERLLLERSLPLPLSPPLFHTWAENGWALVRA